MRLRPAYCRYTQTNINSYDAPVGLIYSLRVPESAHRMIIVFKDTADVL